MGADVCAGMDARAEGSERRDVCAYGPRDYCLYDTPWSEVFAYHKACAAAGTCQEAT